MDATVTDPRQVTPVRGACMFEPGTVFADRYRIERFIAAGGMGEVYAAHDELLDERIAIKVMRPELAAIASAQERFASEIRLARRVTHANVARVFDAGADSGRVFYTMELHEGETLKVLLRRTGPLAVEAARPIVLQVLAAIAAAHEADVIHADLKPSNVIVRRDGRVVVTDFGLAQPCCDTLRCARMEGTPAYMAPEQVMGAAINSGTDLFAFGIILYELLTGKLPWTGDTIDDVMRARLAAEAPSARAVRPDVPVDWDAIVQACLQRERAGRPESAIAVAQRLAAA